MRSIIFLFISFFALTAQVLANSVVNVYSFRKAEIISPLITAFEQEHNVRVNLVYGKPNALLNKFTANADNSQVDVLLTSELGQLQSVKHLLQPINIQTPSIAPQLIDDEYKWVALSLRIRALFSRTNEKPITSYRELDSEQFYGKLCNRDFNHSYNQQMEKSLHAIGNKQDVKWLKSYVSLLNKRPSGGDRDQLRAVFKNQCDYALANHYYYHMLRNSKKPSDREVAASLSMNFLTTYNGKTPVSATAAAISQYAPNKENAQRFVNYLLSSNAQAMIANELHEFAVNKHVRDRQLVHYPNLSLSLQSVKQAL